MMLSFNEYCNMGFGSGYLVSEENQFEKYMLDVEAKINAETHGRIDTENPSETVKICLAKLVNLYAKADIMNDNVSSYSNDGVSKSFVTLSREDYEKAIDATIRTYLANEVDSEGTPLLYLGVR